MFRKAAGGSESFSPSRMAVLPRLNPRASPSSKAQRRSRPYDQNANVMPRKHLHNNTSVAPAAPQPAAVETQQAIRSKGSVSQQQTQTQTQTPMSVPIHSAADLRRPSSGSAMSNSDVEGLLSGSGDVNHVPHLLCEFFTTCFFLTFMWFVGEDGVGEVLRFSAWIVCVCVRDERDPLPPFSEGGSVIPSRFHMSSLNIIFHMK